ncbi:MAG TPA: alpha/beta fold hydrolase [Bryobacteraceae bacterium]|jgi:pimeloyl-ACP methyl ester carboxylesterase|nr:alpha/beta fold hydrolase [Bryobacteraceae bacterium]
MSRRLILWSIGTIGGVAAGLCGFVGVLLCEEATHPPRRPVPTNPSALTVQVTARDGIVLRAWLFQPKKTNGDAVVVLHGIADSRASQVGLARMFLAHGYTVLTPDSRAHGESGGDLATYGLLESDDVHRWISWLLANQRPRHVFGMGESLGGAVLIESLKVEPRFSAIVAESAFSSFERIARDRVAEEIPVPMDIGRVLAAGPVWAGFVYARLRYRLDFRQASPVAALARSTTPVLLIHGLNDSKTPYRHSEILAASNSRYATLWLVPGAGHTGAFGVAPREFENRVLSFYQNWPSGIQLREK